VAFYAFLSIFPAIGALVSIYGLLTDPGELQEKIVTLESTLPAEGAKITSDELQRIVVSQRSQLGLSLAGGILIALWGTSKGMKAMMNSMNVAYDEKEKRGFLKLNSTAALLTLAMILFVIVFLGLIVGIPAVLSNFPMGSTIQRAIDYLRWPLLAAGGIFMLGVLYRYGPRREKPRWEWISTGALLATLVWLCGSFLFSFYVSHFGTYNKTYGSLGAAVILMMWVLLSVYCVLLGAEVDSEIQHQLRKHQ
jgi:membrane protein